MYIRYPNANKNKGISASVRGANCGLLGSYSDSPPVDGGALRMDGLAGLYTPTSYTAGEYVLPDDMKAVLLTGCILMVGACVCGIIGVYSTAYNEKPEWIGEEVTGQAQYYNANM